MNVRADLAKPRTQSCHADFDDSFDNLIRPNRFTEHGKNHIPVVSRQTNRPCRVPNAP